VEVGLGGRLDATRICRAEVTAVTAIGVDHIAELGADPAGIAREKGAIARPGAPMVLGPSTQPVREVLEGQVAAIGTESVWAADRVGLEAVEDVWGWRGRAIWQGPAAEVARQQGEEAAFDWRLPLAGEHMLRNLTTALAIVSCLRERGWRLPTPALATGIAALDWPGRLQLVASPPGRPALLLEVGHNTLAARAVAAHLARRPRAHRRLVMAIASDKDAAGVLDCLLPGTEKMVATTWGGPRALPPEELARCALQQARSAGRDLPVETAPDPVTAVARAGRGLREDGLIVALGSHMLVGPLLAALRRPDAHSLLWP
jgi:dihydrofolate synthase/folylpolyglutamate synthase